MKWILLITLFSYKGAGYIHTEEFTSKEACIAFGNHYIMNMQDSLSGDYIKVRTLCIPKEEK